MDKEKKKVFINKSVIFKIVAFILCFTVIATIVLPNRSNGIDIVAYAANVNVKYCTHVQNSGWQKNVSNGATAGTTGQGKRIEAIKIKVSGLNSGAIKYRTHIQNSGWQAWKKSGAVSGTTGKGLRAEAIQIKLSGKYAKKYDVVYRVHIQNFGWLAWTKNGGTAGSTNMAYRMEAIQIKLLKKGSYKPTGRAYVTPIGVTYCAHVQDIGWQKNVSNGATAGTTGKSKRMEAIKIACKDLNGKACIQYSAHVQDIGWQPWASSGSLAGTTGKGKRLEAIKIKLTGSATANFDVYYRVHVSNYGWLDWTKNGAAAGSTGRSLPVEAIQIRVLSKANTGIKVGSRAFIKEHIPTANEMQQLYNKLYANRNSIQNNPSGYSGKSCVAVAKYKAKENGFNIDNLSYMTYDGYSKIQPTNTFTVTKYTGKDALKQLVAKEGQPIANIYVTMPKYPHTIYIDKIENNIVYFSDNRELNKAITCSIDNFPNYGSSKYEIGGVTHFIKK